MTTALADLPLDQRALLESWLPGAVVVTDHTWVGLRQRLVLELLHRGERYVAKAGGPTDGHMDREIRAHREWLAPWTSRGRAPAMVHADLEARLLLTRFLPGRLVEGSPYADEPDTFRQAGALLALLHDQSVVVDDDYERREAAKSGAWLDRPHRIAPGVEARLRDLIASWDTFEPTPLVPTHGDWQPRNWLVEPDGTVSVIDFGRADLRPAESDLVRLAAQDFRSDPALEAAFLDGYGRDPRSPTTWHRLRVREAISTTVWAHQVGDEQFEQQGHRMIAEALADPGPRVG
ncbi:MAG: phosphotransferase family protein [Nocardioides sp.]